MSIAGSKDPQLVPSEEQKVSNENAKDMMSFDYFEGKQRKQLITLERFQDQSIQRSQIVEAKNELDFLLCPICINILFKPISCSECTQSFCKACIDQWTMPKVPKNSNNYNNRYMGNNNNNNNNNNGLVGNPDEDDEDHAFLFRQRGVGNDMFLQGNANNNSPDIVYPQLNNNNIQLQQQQQLQLLGQSNNIQLPSAASPSQAQQQLQLQQAQLASTQQMNRQSCPHCKKLFKGSNMPLINKLLASMKVRCFYSENGCEEVLAYDSYEKHCLKCEYSGVECDGCKEVIILKDLEAHTQNCQFIKEKCSICGFSAARKNFSQAHTDKMCMQTQLTQKDKQIEQLSVKVDLANTEINIIRAQLQRIMMGVPEQLSVFPFQTVFTNHFKFSENRATLERISFNETKKKYDFLHFFLNRPFFVHGPLIQIFKVKLDRLQGNVLMGISDSQQQNSLDFMVNKQGEIKKKEKLENKYKQRDKVQNFTMQENNTILIKYMPFCYTLEFTNVDLNVTCKMDSTYLLEFSHSFYFFFSLDHQHDSISFSPYNAESQQ